MDPKSWTGLGLALLLMTAGQADAGPKAVLSQTIRGVTVRLSHAGWGVSELPPDRPTSARSFYLSYTVQTDRPRDLPLGRSLLDYVTNVALITPEGWDIRSDGSRRLSGAGGATASAAWISGDPLRATVDPRWPVVGIDLDFQDPDAPARTAGRRVGPITISNIPIPPEMGRTSKIHAEAVTPLGTRVVVQGVQTLRGAGEATTTFVYQIVPDADAPDLQFHVSSGSRAVDDIGTTMGRSKREDVGGPMEYQTVERSVTLSGLPAPGAKTISLTLEAVEWSKQIEDGTSHRHFHFLVPLPPPPRPAPHPPLMTQTGCEVVGEVDALDWQGWRDHLRLLLRDRRDPDVRWEVRALHARDDAGRAIIGHGSSHDDGFFWKADGTAVTPGEAALDTPLGTYSPYSPGNIATSPPAKTLTLTADVAAVRQRNHSLNFTRIPIPADGQTLTLNQAVTDASGDRLVLRRVMAYSPVHPLPSTRQADVYPPPPSGMAVVLAERSNAVSAPSVDYTLIAADDSAGRHLGPDFLLDGFVFIFEGDALRGMTSVPPGDPSRLITLFLRPPAPGAKTFNLRMNRPETVDLHKHETLTFPDLPAPRRP